MISVLVVGQREQDLEELPGRHPSVEVLTAHGVEDTMEKLGRNRRIDAVLLLAGEANPAIIGAIREDNPAHPPIYLPAGQPAPRGIRTLPTREPAELLDLLLRELES
jgi:hypothetical protein